MLIVVVYFVKVTSCVYDELLIFNMKDLDKETFADGLIRIACYDANSIPFAGEICLCFSSSFFFFSSFFLFFFFILFLLRGLLLWMFWGSFSLRDFFILQYSISIWITFIKILFFGIKPNRHFTNSSGGVGAQISPGFGSLKIFFGFWTFPYYKISIIPDNRLPTKLQNH